FSLRSAARDRSAVDTEIVADAHDEADATEEEERQELEPCDGQHGVEERHDDEHHDGGHDPKHASYSYFLKERLFCRWRLVLLLFGHFRFPGGEGSASG